MAELGAIASVVQLADVALRISGEVCKFLDAYKGADRNIKLLWDALRDVEANTGNLRRYVIQFRNSKAAVDEHENLSEAIIRAPNGYDTDMLAVKRILPAKPLEKLNEKARWAMKKRETQELMERITQRNSRLTTALGIMESQQSLRIRKDTQEILAKQAAIDVLASNIITGIDSKMQKQKENHVELLSQSRNIVTSIESLKASSNCQHKTLISVAAQQAAHTNNRLKIIDRSGSRIAQSTEQANVKLAELSAQIRQSSKQTQQTIDTMIAEMKGIHTKATFSAAGIDTITRVVREEIRATLTPLVQEIFDQKETHREEALRRLGNLNDAITREIGSDISAQRKVETSDWCALQSGYSHECIANQKGEEPWSMHCESTVAQPHNMAQDSSAPHYTVSTYKRVWSHHSSLGRLKIEITRTNHRINGSPQSRSYTSVEVHFWPAQKYLLLPRISAFYSTAPTPEGYYQLAPIVGLYPVVSKDHPVFAVIRSGDLVVLQRMLATGQIHLKSCDSGEQTLLHSFKFDLLYFTPINFPLCSFVIQWLLETHDSVLETSLTLFQHAAFHGEIDICTFLNGHGLSWYHRMTGYSYFTPIWCWLLGHLTSEPKLWSLSEPLDVLDNIGHAGNYQLDHAHILCVYYTIRLSSNGFDDSKFERDFRRRWPNHWGELMTDVLGVFFELWWSTELLSNTASILHRILRNGRNSNMMTSCHAVPLESMLYQASYNKQKVSRWPTYQHFKQRLPVLSSFGLLEIFIKSAQPQEMSDFGFLICIVLLVVGSAEIHYINPKAFDAVEHWSTLPSYFQLVVSKGLCNEWRLALKLSGRDPDHESLENERRKKQAFKMRGATRSGVDEAILDPPRIDGLRCRRCRRRYCNNHDLSIFE